MEKVKLSSFKAGFINLGIFSITFLIPSADMTYGSVLSCTKVHVAYFGVQKEKDGSSIIEPDTNRSQYRLTLKECGSDRQKAKAHNFFYWADSLRWNQSRYGCVRFFGGSKYKWISTITKSDCNKS